MRWSWKIGQLVGIDLRIHVTFLLLIGWVLRNYWTGGNSIRAMLGGFGFVAALFACVVLHELGHAVTARKFGIRTREITLLPTGGVARLARIPGDPKHELWVALAGPAVNLVVAATLYGWLAFTHGWVPLDHLTVAAGPFVERLLLANTLLALFNLIPAFPMDGGRALRALLASRMPYPRATQFAVTVGQGLALVFGIVGLFTSPLLLLVCFWVWVGASQEAGAAEIRWALSGTPAQAVMLTNFQELESGDTLADAVRLTLRGSQDDFPVVEQGRVIGILTRIDLLLALAEFGQDYPVTAAMRSGFVIAESTEMLETIFERLQADNCHTLPVVHNSLLAGLITMDKLGEYVLIETSMQKRDLHSGLVKRTIRREEQGPTMVVGSVHRGDHPFSGPVRPNSRPIAGDRITQIRLPKGATPC
jgi:Zn-dependent protease/CBS domain-containing protein